MLLSYMIKLFFFIQILSSTGIWSPIPSRREYMLTELSVRPRNFIKLHLHSIVLLIILIAKRLPVKQNPLAATLKQKMNLSCIFIFVQNQ